MNKENLVSIILFCFFTILSVGQNEMDSLKKFDQNDFNRYKIAENTYNFWWYQNSNIWFPKGDTIPYLVDDREYKGVINYGVEYTSVERRNFSYLENFEMYKLKVDIESCKVSKKDSVAVIKGTVRGGWSNNRVFGYKEKENNVDVFIGKIKDTFKFQHLNHFFDPDKVITTYKGEKIKNHIVLDTFPSYYIHSYTHFSTASGSDRKFEIKSRIDKNSVLIFGITNSYAEIYEIGKLVFSDNFKKRDERNNTDEFSFPKVIISNNIHQNDKYNKFKEQKSNYYKVTERAENYILLKKYAKAKEEYDFFLSNDTYVFARDIHNALRCAIKARDYKTAIIWSERLVLKGVSLNYFEDDFFNQLKTLPLWKGFSTKYDSLNKQFNKGYNQNLKQGITQLVEKDQKYYIKNSIGEMNSLDLAMITEEIDEEFINLIRKEGFPTEEKIGLRTTDDGLIFESPPYQVLLVHSYQTKSSKREEIKDLFDKSKPYHDDYRSNISVIKKTGLTCLQIYKGNLYNNKSCGANLAAIQKIKFKFNNPNNFIIDIGEYTIMPYDKKLEKEDEKFIEDHFHFVSKLTDDWLFYEKL